MNFLAHAEVARRLPCSDPATVLGAMLPDLTHLVPLRVVRHRLPAAVAAGWTCHVAADEVFHADPRFRTAVADMTRALRAGGWPRWPAHAAAHVSWELLLDGRWVQRSDPASWFTAVLRSRPFLDSLGPAERPRWDRLVQGQAASPLWASYVDAAPVADRTWRRLRATKAAFDPDGISQLTALLEAQIPSVERLAEPIVQAVVDATSGSATPGSATAEPATAEPATAGSATPPGG